MSGNMVEVMENEEIESLLKGGVLMDGGAAYSLYKKGWGDWIGAKEVSTGKEANFCFEGLRKINEFSNVEGDLTIIPKSLWIFNLLTNIAVF